MKCIAFGAHPDDVELAAAGTLVLAVQAGHEVLIADLTRGERATAGSPEERAAEAAAAARVLGVRRSGLELPDTGLFRTDQAQLERVVRVLRRETPDLVLAPTGRDAHPDHIEAHHLVSRAVFLSALAGFAPEVGPPHRVSLLIFYPSSREMFGRPDVIVDISTVIDRKMAALACYTSQFVRVRGGPATSLNAPGFLERVKARAAAVGIDHGIPHGEPFFLDRPLATTDPMRLIGFMVPPREGGGTP